jgi:hypothetical protein
MLPNASFFLVMSLIAPFRTWMRCKAGQNDISFIFEKEIIHWDWQSLQESEFKFHSTTHPKKPLAECEWLFHIWYQKKSIRYTLLILWRIYIRCKTLILMGSYFSSTLSTALFKLTLPEIDLYSNTNIGQNMLQFIQENVKAKGIRNPKHRSRNTSGEAEQTALFSNFCSSNVIWPKSLMWREVAQIGHDKRNRFDSQDWSVIRSSLTVL